MLYKHDHLEKEFLKSDIRLQIITLSIDGFCKQHFDKELVITCVLRDDPNSVHGHGRGLDFRIKPKVGKAYFTGTEVEKIVGFCNHFIYDPKRPSYSCLFVHDSGSGLHGHVQVSPDDEVVITA